MTLSRTNPRAKPRWAVLVVAVCALTIAGALVAQAQLDRTLFELDKDASAGNTFKNSAGAPAKIAVLNSAVSTSATSITICQDVANASSDFFYNGAKVLINGERLTLGTGSAAGGGGCPAGFGNKVSYPVTRGVDGTTPGAHAKAEDVSRFAAATDASDDWNQVYASVSADTNDEGDDDRCIALGAVECTFIHDGRAMSIFTSSKDYDEISHALPTDTYPVWQWRNQSVPDADELDDGMAIKYVDGSGDQQIYFGMDRFAVNGTKDAGIWLFHNEIAALDPVGSADGLFSGLHTAPDPGDNGVFCNGSATPNCAPYDADDTGGDVFILTSFSGGGATVTARVFEWIGPAGSPAALLQRSTGADCVPGSGGQVVCATVNNTTIESGTFGGTGLWPYDGKSEPVDNEIASGGQSEGGANLTDLGLEGCFSSVMWATRSSDTLTADPKDWILGKFEACDTELTTTPKDGSGGALAADSDADNLDEITIGTDGTVDVTDSAVLNVKGTTTFSGSLSFYVCGPIANPAACDDGGFQAGFTGNPVTVNGTYVSDPVTLTSVGRYCWFGFFDSDTDGVPDASDATIESPGDPNADPPIPYSTGECFEVLPVTPTLTTTAWSSGSSSGSAQTTPVDFGSQVFDRADLSGTAKTPGDNGSNTTYPTIEATNGADANGTITFTLVGPDGEATDCTTLAVSSDPDNEDNPEDVTVSGDDDYYTSGFTPNAPGDYHWKASYTGDSPNTLGTSHNDECTEAGEDVTVRQIPTEISTRQRAYPNDAARIESSEPSVNLPAGGEVVFRLYVAGGENTAAENCADHGTILGEGGLVYTETKTLTGGATFETVATNNTTYPLTSLTSEAYWWVTYDPNDSAFTGRQSDCAESTSITFVDDSGPGTLFTPAP